MNEQATPGPTTKSVNPAAPRRRRGYEATRRRILDSATILLNERGISGMTFQEVSQMLSTKTTSITYYFRYKELLAAAVFEDSLSRLSAMVADAARATSPRERVKRYLDIQFEHIGRALLGEVPPLAILSEIRALDDNYRTPLIARYQSVFREVRALFGPSDTLDRKRILTAKTQLLNEALFWAATWLPHYSVTDFAGVGRRLFDILSTGIAVDGSEGTLKLNSEAVEPVSPVRLGLIRAATKLINQFGYKGTSVDRIMREMSQTKGSFYHHLDGKDDLILECYRASHRRLARIQGEADELGGNCWHRLASATSVVLSIQFASDYPLLRTTALQAMPGPVRERAYELGNREALSLAGMLVRGMQDGSVRIIDPLIGAHLIMSTINSAYDIRNWAASQPVDLAVSRVMSLLARGIFDHDSL